MNNVKIVDRASLLLLFLGTPVADEAVLERLREGKYVDENGQITPRGKAIAHKSSHDGINYTNVAKSGKGTNCASMFFSSVTGLRYQIEEKNYVPSVDVRNGITQAIEELVELQKLVEEKV